MVDHDGTVYWNGSTTRIISNGKWTVYIFPLDFSGKVTNSSGKTSDSGTRVIKHDIPVNIPGLAYVKVTISGQGGATCTAGAWIKFTGSPTSSPLWWVALMLLIFGGIAGALLLLIVFGIGAPPPIPAEEQGSIFATTQVAAEVVVEKGDEIGAQGPSEVGE